MAGMGGEEVEAVDGEAELAGLGELADARADGVEAIAADVGGAPDERLGGVVDLVLLEAEHVAAGGGAGFGALDGGAVDDVREVLASELEELLEYGGRLLLVERAHRGGERLGFWLGF